MLFHSWITIYLKIIKYFFEKFIIHLLYSSRLYKCSMFLKILFKLGFQFQQLFFQIIFNFINIKKQNNYIIYNYRSLC